MKGKLNRKHKVALARLADHYAMMSTLCLAMLNEDEGKFYGEGNLVWANPSEGLSIRRDKDGTPFVKSGSDNNPHSRYVLDEPIILDMLNEVAPITRKFKVWFQVMGRYTDSNSIGYATVEAKDKEQAEMFAKEDLLTKKRFKDIEVVCQGRNEEFDNEDEAEEGRFNYDVDWEATGKHGRYCARTGPYAKSEDEAEKLARADLTKRNGFMNLEAPLDVEEEED